MLIFTFMSLALTWPLARTFQSEILNAYPGNPQIGDAQLCLWILWNVEQWARGVQPLLLTHMLYYPRGITLLTAGMGPLSGFFSLPFWHWGPAAAYNGTVLVGLTLTGYCMYLLARGIGFDEDIALFAGIFLQVSPLHLAGLQGHLDKVFIGLQPLAVLTVLHALDLTRRSWWALATVLVLFLLFFHNGYQFVFAALAAGYFMLVAIITALPRLRFKVIQRCAIVAVGSVLMIGPALYASLDAARDPSFGDNVRVNTTSGYFAPDAIEFVIPSYFQASFRLVEPFVGGLVPGPYPTGWIGLYSMESAVSIPLISMFLCVVAWRKAENTARRWTVFTLMIVFLSLGPVLRIFGRARFTDFELPIPLPYTFLVSMPGLQFMRTPTRFMEIGAVGLGIASCFGLDWLHRRVPRRRTAIMAAAMVLLLVQSWPTPWKHRPLPTVPAFYHELAHDPEMYGVLDLPGGASDLDSVYQMYQITHQKAIPWGYLAHAYADNPVRTLAEYRHFGATAPDLTVNGQPNALYASANDDLVTAGYRYVVWHKNLFRQLRNTADPDAETLLHLIVGTAVRPTIDTDETAVYALSRTPPPLDTVPSMQLGTMWQSRQAGSIHRWTPSPATIDIVASAEEPALLHLTLASVYDPNAPNGFGSIGILTVQTTQQDYTVDVTTGLPVTIPVQLVQGRQTITLSLQSGNWQRATSNGDDPQTVSFALQSADLQTVNVAPSSR